MKLTTKTTLLALCLAAGGCSTMEFKALGSKEALRNDQGHVIGMKETLSDVRGEQLARLSLYVPRFDNQGTIIGYEEPVKGGMVVLRDLDGKPVGGRYVDLRSRGTNAQNRGVTIVFHSKPRERVAMAAAPSIDELMHLARLAN